MLSKFVTTKVPTLKCNTKKVPKIKKEKYVNRQRHNFKFKTDYTKKNKQNRRWYVKTQNSDKFYNFIEMNNVEIFDNASAIDHINNSHVQIEFVSHNLFDKFPFFAMYNLIPQSKQKRIISETLNKAIIYYLPYDVLFDKNDFHYSLLGTMYLHEHDVSDQIDFVYINGVGERCFYIEGDCNQRYFARILNDSKKLLEQIVPVA